MADALRDLIEGLSLTKTRLGMRYAEWSASAPTLEACCAAAAMAQEELGHARVLWGVVGTEEDDEVNANPYAGDPPRRWPAFLSAPLPDWGSVACAIATADRALTIVLERAAHSREERLRQRVRKILDEESFHSEYGDGWLRQLRAYEGTLRAHALAVGRWLGPERGGAAEALKQIGLDVTPDSLWHALCGRLRLDLQRPQGEGGLLTW